MACVGRKCDPLSKRVADKAHHSSQIRCDSGIGNADHAFGVGPVGTAIGGLDSCPIACPIACPPVFIVFSCREWVKTGGFSAPVICKRFMSLLLGYWFPGWVRLCSASLVFPPTPFLYGTSSLVDYKLLGNYLSVSASQGVSTVSLKGAPCSLPVQRGGPAPCQLVPVTLSVKHLKLSNSIQFGGKQCLTVYTHAVIWRIEFALI